MYFMFASTTALTSLTINSATFNTSLVTNMNGMFQYSGLTLLDISFFNTESVTDMTNMFYGDSKLTTLKLLNWTTPTAINTGMFTNVNTNIVVHVNAAFNQTFITNAAFPTAGTIVIGP